MSTNTAYWLIIQNDQLIIDDSTSTKVLTQEHITKFNLKLSYKHRIADLDGTDIFCAELAKDFQLPASLTAVPLRKALDLLGNKWYNVGTRAFAIINWDKNNLFCGHCGQQTQQKKSSTFERICPDCGLAIYPRISPSIIVRINKGDEILMARSPHFAPGVFALIAGFVEAGENIEETVHREVKEEVNITIKNLRYFGSQPWPFPDSLMLGFTAEYDSGELKIDNNELEAAGWYRYDQLPGRPSHRTSMAYKLIEHFIAQKKQNSLR